MIQSPADTPKPTFIGGLIALVVGLLILAVVAEILLRVAMPHWREFHSGWFMKSTVVPGHANVATGVPGFDGYFAQNNGDFRVHVTVNDFGLRNPEPVANANNRVWVVGDSMTFGWGVEQQQMYSSRLAVLSNRPTYNIASPGASVCGYQALVARMPKDVQPAAVIVGLVLENDVLRYNCVEAARRSTEKTEPNEAISFIRVKRFLTKYFALYNFASVSLKRVPLIEHALVFLGVAAKGHQYRQYIGDDEVAAAVGETVTELLRLKAQLPQNSPFAVMIAPARFEIKDGAPFYKKLRETVITALNEKGIATIDPTDGFMEKGFAATHFAHDGHWKPLGHEIAAAAIAGWLSSQSQ